MSVDLTRSLASVDFSAWRCDPRPAQRPHQAFAAFTGKDRIFGSLLERADQMSAIDGEDRPSRNPSATPQARLSFRT
jgi:hypothetical protein